eukprot:scaffold66254_cov57-Phaeocystis_antarctica.AAC.2
MFSPCLVDEPCVEPLPEEGPPISKKGCIESPESLPLLLPPKLNPDLPPTAEAMPVMPASSASHCACSPSNDCEPMLMRPYAPLLPAAPSCASNWFSPAKEPLSTRLPIAKEPPPIGVSGEAREIPEPQLP